VLRKRLVLLLAVAMVLASSIGAFGAPAPADVDNGRGTENTHN
jgi:hypothetical protein